MWCPKVALVGDDTEPHGWGERTNQKFARRVIGTIAVVNFSADKLAFPFIVDLNVPTHLSKEP